MTTELDQFVCDLHEAISETYNIREYFSLDYGEDCDIKGDLAQLDGRFTSVQLRAIADGLDQYTAKKHGREIKILYSPCGVSATFTAPQKDDIYAG